MKLIIFDLDGVLIDSKDIHHSALNKAIELFDKNTHIIFDDVNIASWCDVPICGQNSSSCIGG